MSIRPRRLSLRVALALWTSTVFTLTFSLSALSLLAPSGVWWGLFVVICSAAAFVLGSFLPMPYADRRDAESMRSM